jgi:hypothetical protein
MGYSWARVVVLQGTSCSTTDYACGLVVSYPSTTDQSAHTGPAGESHDLPRSLARAICGHENFNRAFARD